MSAAGLAISPAAAARDRREALTAWLFSLPALALLSVMLPLPALAVFFVAFTDWQLGNNSIHFAGTANFESVLKDPVFWTSLRNTLVYAVVVVPASMALGLGLALLVNAGPSLRGFYGAVFFLPFTASLVAMALVWQILLHPTIGPVNALLAMAGLPTHNFLHDPNLALPTLMVIGIWQLSGYAMLLNLAGLRAIPPDLYEAARMDGARGAWSRFTLVTWPQLGPTTLFVFVVSSMTALQVFETVAVLTKGQPARRTEVMLYTIYNEGFVFLRTNYAAALMIIFLVVLCGVMLLNVLTLEKRVHY
ncbi:MAG: sugar ABC transporter permease [Rhizobiales bacterium]|nr:sugar ABC transporter permease [Hyphomicrobiales bacterium]